MKHEPNCIWGDEDNPGPAFEKGSFHRFPIDCCTVDDLLKANKKLRQEVESFTRQIMHLKARLYDFEHERGEYND